MTSNAPSLLTDESLSDILGQIAAVLRNTVAMPRAAEAIDEAAKRLKERGE